MYIDEGMINALINPAKPEGILIRRVNDFSGNGFEYCVEVIPNTEDAIDSHYGYGTDIQSALTNTYIQTRTN